MFQKILVAIDNSAISEQVFNTALSLAKTMEATLILLHFLSVEEKQTPDIPRISLSYYSKEMNQQIMMCEQKQWETFEKQWLDFLRSAQRCDNTKKEPSSARSSGTDPLQRSRTQKATFAGINTQFMQNFGSPGKTIRELARTWGADLIVIGHRGHSGINNLAMESVSNYLFHNAPCSVLVVQPQNSNDPEIIQKNKINLSL